MSGCRLPVWVEETVAQSKFMSLEWERGRGDREVTPYNQCPSSPRTIIFM